MKRIDAHIHYAGHHPAATRLLEEFEVTALNICVAGSYEKDWRAEQAEPWYSSTILV